MARILMPQIRSIQKLCVPSKTNNGDGKRSSALNDTDLIDTSSLCIGRSSRRHNEILQETKVHQKYNDDHRWHWHHRLG